MWGVFNLYQSKFSIHNSLTLVILAIISIMTVYPFYGFADDPPPDKEKNKIIEATKALMNTTGKHIHGTSHTILLLTAMSTSEKLMSKLKTYVNSDEYSLETFYGVLGAFVDFIESLPKELKDHSKSTSLWMQMGLSGVVSKLEAKTARNLLEGLAARGNRAIEAGAIDKLSKEALIEMAENYVLAMHLMEHMISYTHWFGWEFGRSWYSAAVDDFSKKRKADPSPYKATDARHVENLLTLLTKEELRGDFASCLWSTLSTYDELSQRFSSAFGSWMSVRLASSYAAISIGNTAGGILGKKLASRLGLEAMGVRLLGSAGGFFGMIALTLALEVPPIQGVIHSIDETLVTNNKRKINRWDALESYKNLCKAVTDDQVLQKQYLEYQADLGLSPASARLSDAELQKKYPHDWYLQTQVYPQSWSYGTVNRTETALNTGQDATDKFIHTSLEMITNRMSKFFPKIEHYFSVSSEQEQALDSLTQSNSNEAEKDNTIETLLEIGENIQKTKDILDKIESVPDGAEWEAYRLELPDAYVVPGDFSSGVSPFIKDFTKLRATTFYQMHIENLLRDNPVLKTKVKGHPHEGAPDEKALYEWLGDYFKDANENHQAWTDFPVLLHCVGGQNSVEGCVSKLLEQRRKNIPWILDGQITDSGCNADQLSGWPYIHLDDQARLDYVMSRYRRLRQSTDQTKPVATPEAQVVFAWQDESLTRALLPILNPQYRANKPLSLLRAVEEPELEVVKIPVEQWLRIPKYRWNGNHGQVLYVDPEDLARDAQLMEKMGPEQFLGTYLFSQNKLKQMVIEAAQKFKTEHAKNRKMAVSLLGALDSIERGDYGDLGQRRKRKIEILNERRREQDVETGMHHADLLSEDMDNFRQFEEGLTDAQLKVEAIQEKFPVIEDTEVIEAMIQYVSLKNELLAPLKEISGQVKKCERLHHLKEQDTDALIGLSSKKRLILNQKLDQKTTGIDATVKYFQDIFDFSERGYEFMLSKSNHIFNFANEPFTEKKFIENYGSAYDAKSRTIQLEKTSTGIKVTTQVLQEWIEKTGHSIDASKLKQSPQDPESQEFTTFYRKRKTELLEEIQHKKQERYSWSNN